MIALDSKSVPGRRRAPVRVLDVCLASARRSIGTGRSTVQHPRMQRRRLHPKLRLIHFAARTADFDAAPALNPIPNT